MYSHFPQVVVFLKNTQRCNRVLKRVPQSIELGARRLGFSSLQGPLAKFFWFLVFFIRQGRELSKRVVGNSNSEWMLLY